MASEEELEAIQDMEEGEDEEIFQKQKASEPEDEDEGEAANGNTGNDNNEDDEEEENEEEDEDDDDGSDDDSDSSGSGDDEDDNDDQDDDEEEDDDDDNDDTNDNNKDNDNNDGLSAYERLRLERIKRNRERLIQLGLESKEEGGGVLGKKKKKPVQRRKSNDSVPQQPTRKSRRSLEPKSYVEPSLRGLLQTVKNNQDGDESKPAKAPKEPKTPKEPKPRKLTKRDLRPTREIYDEFQAIRKHKKRTLQQAQKHVRYAEKEVLYWHRKAVAHDKKLYKKSSQRKRQYLPKTAQQKQRDVEVFGQDVSEFVEQLEQRKDEIETKIAEYDMVTLTPEQMVEREAIRMEHQHKLELLQATQVIPQSLENMAQTLSTCLLERTPKDRPPPRRSRRSTDVAAAAPHATVNGNEDQAEVTTQPNNKKRGRKRKKATQETQEKSWQEQSDAATLASLSQLEQETNMLVGESENEANANESENNNNDSTTTKEPNDNDAATPKGEIKTNNNNVGGWVDATFAARLDRSWLDQDAPQIPLKSLKTYIPQPGDTILYYPAGHFAFLNQYPDPPLSSNSGVMDRIPLWKRAAQERSQQQQQARAAALSSSNQSNSNWWTDDWIDKAEAGNDRLPILCRVVQAQAEFPPDSNEGANDTITNNTVLSSAQQQQSKSRQRPVLRLAVTLRPLTPITPPSWNDSASTLVQQPVPPEFTCVTFPSPTVSSYLIPFAWSYIRNQSLVVGEEVLHSPVKASVTGKPLHQRGKLLSLATAVDDEEEEYGSFRLDDKLEYVAKVISMLKKDDEHNNVAKGNNSESLVGGLSPQDSFVIGDFLEGVLRKHGGAVDSNGAITTTDADMMTLIRATLPTWMGASVQRGFEDRTRLELQPWDIKTKDGPRGGDFASTLNTFMESGLHNTIDNMLRLKIECCIEDYMQANPTTFPFHEQITEAVAPDYGAAVPITMSFRRILARLKQKGKRPDPNAPCYYRTVGAILADIQAIADNCRLYNSSDSVLARSAREVVIDAKKYVSGIVMTHVREFRDKLKKEAEKKQFLAAFVGEHDEADDSENAKSMDPFHEPWKGPLFRDWIQSWQVGPHRHGSNFPHWVPQAGDAVLYSREQHEKFVEGHLDSLSDNQCIEARDSSSGESKWITATIISVGAEFPRVRKPSEQGTFDTDAPVLALRLQFSDTSSGEEQSTSVIYWRPCMFPSDLSDEMNPESVCCKACGLQVSTSFLRPSWEGDLADGLQVQGDETGVQQGLPRDEKEQIERNLCFLKRRCLLHVLPDKYDANLSTDQVKNGYFPPPVKVSQNTLPRFDQLLNPVEVEPEAVSSRLSKKKEVSPPEIDTSALNSLAAVGFLPPWLPQLNEARSSKKKFSATLLHESVSPWPNLCLELVLLRIKNGYYRHLKAVHNDLAEAFLNTQLLSWAPAAKKKVDPIAMKKLAKAVWSTKYTVTTSDLPFTSITQAIVAKPEAIASETKASVKVRILFEDPKENNEISTKGRKKVAKKPSAKGQKKNAALSSSIPEKNEMVLIAEVPIRSLRSLGQQEFMWVQCDTCKKWRRLRGLVADQKLPSRWYCSMNKNDPAHARCSAPEEEYDDAANENVSLADGPANALSEEESSFAAHAELVRRLYASALAGISEPKHFSVVFGLTPLRVNRQRLLSTIVPQIVTQADNQAAFARNQLVNLLKAIGRDPSKIRLPHSINLRISVDGELISAPASSPDDPAPAETPVGVDKIKFGKRNLKSNNKLTRVLLKPPRNHPCVRCQAERKGLFTCRVLKSHSNIDFDLYKNFRGGGGLDGLLCTMLKLPPPPPKVHKPDTVVSTGEPEGLVQSQSVASAVTGEEKEKPHDDVGGGQEAGVEGATASKTNSVEPPAAAAATTENGKEGAVGDSVAPPSAAAADNGKESAVGESGGNDQDKVDPGEMYSKATAALELAKELEAEAEAFSEAPDRLSNHFIATTFPFDYRDNSYAFCIICGLPGDLLLCDKHDCPNVMHYGCGGLSEVPEADWFCGQCVPIPSTGDDPKEEETTDAAEEGKSTSVHSTITGQDATTETEKSPNKPEPDEVDVKEGDTHGETEESNKKPATVTSCLPPIVSFDHKKEAELSSELDDLFFARTGRRRGVKNDEEKPTKLGVGTLFQKRFGHQGYFTGKVVTVPTSEHPFFKVKYQEDSDEEDLTEEELHELLAKTNQRKLARKRKKNPQGEEEEKEEKSPRKRRADANEEEDEPENSSRKRGRPRKRPADTSDDEVEIENGKSRRRKRPLEGSSVENGSSKRGRPAKSPAKARAVEDNNEDPLLRLVDVMQKFLATQNIETAKDFMATKTSDLADALVKWRAKKKLPVLKGSGAVATISAAKGQIRRIISERGLDPLPEMKRSGLIYPGSGGAPGDDGGDDDRDNNVSREVELTPRREGKRQSRVPDRLGSRRR